MGTPLPGTGVPGWGAGCKTKTSCSSGGTFTAGLFLLILNCHMWVWNLPVPFLQAPYQSHQGFFFISLVMGLLFMGLQVVHNNGAL